MVIFVGAGLSSNLKNYKGETIGDWDNLVKKLFEGLTEKSYTLPEIKKSAMEMLELLEAQRKVSPTDIEDFASDFYTLHEDENNFSPPRLFLRVGFLSQNFKYRFAQWRLCWSCSELLSAYR